MENTVTLNERPRIIAGSGRSGTTWILDVLAETNGLRPVFEPLHPDAVPAAAPYADRLIAQDAIEPELETFFHHVFASEFRSIWCDYRIRPNRLKLRAARFTSPGAAYGLFVDWRGAMQRFFKHRRHLDNTSVLVKLVRANLMLGWLRQHFDARIVFVTRHAGAVVESKLRGGKASWDPAPLMNYYRSASATDPYLGRFRDLLNEDLSPAETQTLIWCIENIQPVEQAKVFGYLAIFYEDLVKDGATNWAKVIDALGLTSNPHGTDIVTRPSQQASAGFAQSRKGGGTTWRDRLSSADHEGVDRILRTAGVDWYAPVEPDSGEGTSG